MPQPLPERMLELVARRFRALGEPQRLRILQALECGEKTVNEVVDALGGNQSNISRHLQALFDAGLVVRRRDGNHVYYSISDPVVFQLCEIVCRSTTQQIEEQFQSITAAASTRSRKRA